jgi:hypothetical protein
MVHCRVINIGAQGDHQGLSTWISNEEEFTMLDYNASVIARQEHEQRVRSLVPVQEYDDRLNDDRQLSVWPIRAGIALKRNVQPDWLSRRVGQLFITLGSRLTATGERLRQRRA